jgi:hypothetical protein
MYPSSLQTNLRGREGAYVQTSLARTFPHDGQTGLSLVARSTFPRNKSGCELRATSYGQTEFGLLGARGSKLEADCIRSFGTFGEKPGL